VTHTAKTLYRKFEKNIPRNETVRPHSQFLHSCIWEQFIFSHPTIGLIWNPYFLYCVIELSAQLYRSGEKGRELLPSSCWRQFPVLPSAVELGVHINDPTYKLPIWKITDHKWIQLILLDNFLFRLRVNEIPIKIFILNSHRPFLCSIQKAYPTISFSGNFNPVRRFLQQELVVRLGKLYNG
jgi:hypothetical protein